MLFLQSRTVANCLRGFFFLERNFLSLYQIHQLVWNSKYKNIQIKHMRENCNEQPVAKCEGQFRTADREFVVKKIHTFYCSVRRELQKVLEPQNPGTSADDVGYVYRLCGATVY
jgi:hypothetical protein